MSYWNEGAEFSDLNGKHLTAVFGLLYGNDSVRFVCSDGSEYVMEHHQDCCENVSIEDVCGDVNDLEDAVVLDAYETTSDDYDNRDGEYMMWTFYNIRTNKGSVTIRWFGESNGYYSVGVSFDVVKKATDDA